MMLFRIQKKSPEGLIPEPDFYSNKSMILNCGSTAFARPYPDTFFERSYKNFAISHRTTGAISPGGV